MLVMNCPNGRAQSVVVNGLAVGHQWCTPGLNSSIFTDGVDARFCTWDREGLSRKGSTGADASRFRKSLQCAQQPKGQNTFWEALNSISRWSKEMILPLYLVLVLLHLKYCVQFWAAQSRKDIKVLEITYRCATKLVTGLEGMSTEKRG